MLILNIFLDHYGLMKEKHSYTVLTILFLAPFPITNLNKIIHYMDNITLYTSHITLKDFLI